jgi:hypothetical protein
MKRATLSFVVAALLFGVVAGFANMSSKWSSGVGGLGNLVFFNPDADADLTIQGGEGKAASLILEADEGDDDADTWTLEVSTAGALTVQNSGADGPALTLAAAGPTALSVTNGQEVTLASGKYILTGIGGANDTTNTITLVAPDTPSAVAWISVASASTNLVGIADSGTFAGSGDLLLDANDTAILYSPTTNAWLETPSDN